MSIKLKEARHREIIESINELLVKNSLAEICNLVEIANEFYYQIKNPHKINEAINIYFLEEMVTLCYIDLSSKHIYWHNHLESWLSDYKNSEIVEVVFDNLIEIFKDLVIIFEFYKNGNPYISGCKLLSEIDWLYKKFRLDSYYKNCDILEIRSWTGKHDEIVK